MARKPAPEKVEHDSAGKRAIDTGNPRQPTSRKGKRLLKDIELYSNCLTVAEPASPSTDRVLCGLPTPSPTPMPVARSLPLLICSVGNPGSAFADTLHSAGHTVLNRLQEYLAYPPFHKDRALGNGLVSTAPSPLSGARSWTLWQSTSLMNVSGNGVKSAYLVWLKQLPEGEGRLVIVHDELEKPLGAVNLKTRQGASAKGHNGLKSILAAMGGKEFVRIGVGIGRPLSRESRDVAAFVMRKMNVEEKVKINDCVDEVVETLKKLEQG